MSIFLDPTGKPTFGIGICGRCARTMFLSDLHPDPNAPGLMVCLEDRDVLDPYRLPARIEDRITLPFVRPDEAMSQEEAAPVVGPVVDDTVWAVGFWADGFWAANFWSST